MKIDHNQPSFDPRLTGPQDAERPVTDSKRGPRPEGDRVQVSAGAELARVALTAVERAPDIRRDAVERAKALLASGALGADAARLADALIDRALAP